MAGLLAARGNGVLFQLASCGGGAGGGAAGHPAPQRADAVRAGARIHVDHFDSRIPAAGSGANLRPVSRVARGRERADVVAADALRDHERFVGRGETDSVYARAALRDGACHRAVDRQSVPAASGSVRRRSVLVDLAGACAFFRGGRCDGLGRRAPRSAPRAPRARRAGGSTGRPLRSGSRSVSPHDARPSTAPSNALAHLRLAPELSAAPARRAGRTGRGDLAPSAGDQLLERRPCGARTP